MRPAALSVGAAGHSTHCVAEVGGGSYQVSERDGGARHHKRRITNATTNSA